MSAGTLPEFVKRSSEAAHELVDDEFEIVLVNDGSPDSSLEVALSLIAKGAKIRLIDLSRNFGHHQALMAGLHYVDSERVFLIDSDLEESPEWIIDFWKTMANTESDSVYGVQSRRKGGLFERLSGHVFYSTFNRISQVQIPRDVTTARLMTLRYVKSLLEFRENRVFLAGLFSLAGYKQTPLNIVKGSSSPTTYSPTKRIELGIDAITSFSATPLVTMFKIGLTTFLGALIFLCYLVASWLFMGSTVSGWTSILVSIWLFGGLNILFLGWLGIYVSKTYIETKNRPNFIVREVWPKPGMPTSQISAE
jgi:putative glycosyltransferase